MPMLTSTPTNLKLCQAVRKWPRTASKPRSTGRQPTAPSRFKAASEIHNVRRFATGSTSSPPPSQSKLSTVFTGLIALGLGCTAYGLYDFYATFTMWPQEVRRDLRAGIKAKNQQDLELSERYLRRALVTALALPEESLSPDPNLKLSGIAITLGGVLEDNNKLQAAHDVYSAAFERLQAVEPRSGFETARAGAIAYKAGEIAGLLRQHDTEEQWYDNAIRLILREAIPKQRPITVANQAALTDLGLPPWVDKVDVVEPMRAYAACRQRKGDLETASATLSLATNLLLGEDWASAPAENLCIGTDLANSVANVWLSGPPTPANRRHAETVVRRVVDTLERAKESGRVPNATLGTSDYCGYVLAAALYNWGALQEMEGQLDNAKELYKRSRQQAAIVKEREAVLLAETALRRVSQQAK